MASVQPQEKLQQSQTTIITTEPQPQPTIIVVQAQESCRNGSGFVAYIDMVS